MDIVDKWEKALKNTRIIRACAQSLSTFALTELSYIFLAESSVNIGDSIVRKGRILIDNPSVILLNNLPHFEGFDFDKEWHLNEDMVTNFLLVRNVKFPSYRYDNKIHSLNIYEGSLDKAIEYFLGQLQKKEDIHTGLIVGPEDCWQFSVIVFISAMIDKSTDKNIRELLENMRRKKGFSGDFRNNN